jgi:hypothetical protein
MFESNWISKLEYKAPSSCEFLGALRDSQPCSLCFKPNSQDKSEISDKLQREYNRKHSNDNYVHYPII